MGISIWLIDRAWSRKRLARCRTFRCAAHSALRLANAAAAVLALSLLGATAIRTVAVDDPNIADMYMGLSEGYFFDVPGIGEVEVTGDAVSSGTTSAVIHRDAALPLPNVGDLGHGDDHHDQVISQEHQPDSGVQLVL